MKYNKLDIPNKLLVLDLVGFVLVFVGALEWFSQIGLVPEPLRFPRFELVMVAIGIIFMMPLITHIATHFKRTAKQPNDTQ